MKELLNSQSSNNKTIYSQLIDADVSEESVIRYWEIHDGNGIKPSTNGVWLFCSHTYRIYDGFTVRLGKSKFQINKIEHFNC